MENITWSGFQRRRVSEDRAEQFVSGLDRAALEECVEGNETAALVDEDVQRARRLGVTGTPTVFVNGQRIDGSQDISDEVRKRYS